MAKERKRGRGGMFRGLAIMALAVMGGGTWAHSGGAPIAGEIILVLEDGIGRAGGTCELTLTMTYSDGAVKDLWGDAEGYNTAVHEGVARDAKVTADGIEFVADVLINPDQFVPGGWACYTVKVARAAIPIRPGTGENGYWQSSYPDLTTGRATGALAGTFSGTFTVPGNTNTFAGRAVGIVLPLVHPGKGFMPPAEHEHPRLLLRKNDVAALKARLKTPLGQALLAQLNQSGALIAKAMLALLTGEKSYAEAATAAAQDILSQDGMNGNEILKTLVWGGRLTQIALTYDLAYDWLTPEARTQMETYLKHFGARTTYKPWNYCDPHSHMLLTHGAPHVMGIYPGGGMAALALYGLKNEKPDEPVANLKKVPDPPPPFMSKTQLERIKAMAAARMVAYEAELKTWAYECDLWEASGGADVNMRRLLMHTHAHMATNIRKGIGEGGFKGSGEGHVHMWYPLVGQYAMAYRNVCGEPVTGRPDIGYFVPRYIATTIFGDNDGVNQGFGGGGGNAGLVYTSQAMALCPPEYQPAVLWYWLKLLGVTPEEVGTAEGARKIAERSAKAVGGGSEVSGLALLNTLVNFPVDAETGKLSLQPKNPGEVLPHVWEAKTYGLYAFRNRWQGGDDIVAQIFAQQKGSCGWGLPDTADVLIHGLGHAWFQKGTTGTRTFRVMNTVVILPDDLINEGGTGRVTYFGCDSRSGSGSVTINLDNVYEGRKLVPKTNTDGTPEIVSATGLPAMRKVPADTGIRGLRAFAADYSGKAGVPALFVLVDRITGGNRKEWIYHVPKSGSRRRGDALDLAMRDNGFALAAQDGTSMQLTFVSPTPLKLERITGTHDIGTAKAGRIVQATMDALCATSADPNIGEFFAILTLQKGDPPAVTAEGVGLAAKVTVGEQTVSFDGEKIVIGD